MQPQSKRVTFVLLVLAFSVLSSQNLPTVSHQRKTAAQVIFEFSEVVRVAPDPRERAVAFHSITFIDSIAHPISEIIFGTPEANALQGEGWFQNQRSPEIGTFQWAGGAAKQASMQLTIPTGTEGLLLKMTSVKDSLWMNVKIDGTLAATLRVDAYWHSGYVPVGDAIPEPVSGSEPEWIEGRYFPHFPPTDRVYAFRVRSTLGEDYYPKVHKPEWRIHQSLKDMMAFTLAGMQGIINRSGSRVYLDWINYRGHNNFWISELEKHIEVVYLELDGLSAVNFLLRRYASRFSGAVIYDPEVPETINLATMIAGLEDRLILAPQQLGLPGIPSFASIMDLRQLVQAQGWDASIASQIRIYQWVYDNLWPRLEHRIIGVLSPGPPTSREMQPGEYWPLEMASRDYMVALRLPTLYLDPESEPQSSLLASFLEDAPSPIPLAGVFAGTEVSTTAFASRHGDWQGAFPWPGEITTVGNLTVHSGVRPEVALYKPEMNTARILATLGNHPVTTMFSTDGDAIFYLMQRGFNFFSWENVQNQRFGWTTNPTLAELAPVIWNYYVRSRSEVSFLSSLSGAGYMYPQLMSGDQLDAYLAYTARYFNDTGLRVVQVDDRKGPWSKELAAHYDKGLRDASYLGVIVGYGGPPSGLGFDYFDTPAPTVWPAYALRAQNENQVIADIVARKPPGEEFINIVDASNPNCPLVTDPDAYGGQAIFVPRSFRGAPSCCLAIGSGRLNLPPGDYTVIFRMKVADNQNTAPVTAIYVGEKPTDWHTIVYQTIAPSDFNQANRYQDFTVSFSLARLTHEIEFRVDYLAGTTDLYFDYFHAIRQSGPALPVFATVLVPMIVPVEEMQFQAGAPGRFQRGFEQAGGIVLTPDEFMAALNPKYMIDFAMPILGGGHAAITQAQQQLDAGEYINSLLTVRDALRQINGPKVSLDFTSIDFDTVEIGDKQSKELVIGNHGTASLNVSSVTITNKDFKVTPTVFSIPPVNSQTITVRFTPRLHQVYSDTLVIRSNAIDNSIVKVPISATGVYSQAPRITAIKDVPNDQGGHVRITFYPSRYDGSDATYRIAYYSAWRLLENDNWELLGSFDARQDSIYHAVTLTLGDSTATGIAWTIFRISAHTDSSEIFFISRPDSGYSVDNIAPNVPQGVAAQPVDDGILLTWKRNQENDLQQYAIYRATQANFDPAAMATYTYATADTFYLDEKVGRDTTFYYAISAFDRAGNESGFSAKVSAGLVTEVADGDDQQIPKQYRLYQNYPNPFNAMTKIRFDLPKGSEVKISVFDVKGNLVKEISKRDYKAGHHEEILNTTGFATGIYFYKIEAGKFVEVKKLLLIK